MGQRKVLCYNLQQGSVVELLDSVRGTTNVS